jgi:16S rRNA (guanine966-N2)-methyltransferase
MRVTGGQFKGRGLFGPKDDRVRPTSDKVREAIFNILTHGDFDDFSLEGARALDLFAGTGAMGIEALSRGAAFSLFVDDHLESRAIIRRNVEALNLTGATKIWRRDATRLDARPPNAGGAFELIFVDPPYRKGLGALALASARAGDWIAPNAVIVLEEASDQIIPAIEGFVQIDRREYGDTQAIFYQLS